MVEAEIFSDHPRNLVATATWRPESVPLLLSRVSRGCFTNASLISRNASRGTPVYRKGEWEKIHGIYKRENRHKRLW